MWIGNGGNIRGGIVEFLLIKEFVGNSYLMIDRSTILT
jgi:hypothetical protein